MTALKDIWKSYQKGDEEVHALRGVTLGIGAGEKVALVGPSGAGKSTLLYLIGLMDLPSKGEQRLLNEDPLSLSDKERSKLRGKTIGVVFQAFNLIAQLKAWENVALPLRYAGVGAKERKARALAMLERVGLQDRAEHYPSELSGGQEQRVAIARALVIHPKLVLADEPTGNLDSAAGARVMVLLDELHAQGATLVIVTHSPEIAARAERMIRVVDGCVMDGRG